MSEQNPTPPNRETNDAPKKTSDQRDPDQGDDDTTAEKKPSKLKDPKVQIGLAVAGVVVLVSVAIGLTWDWTTGRYHQSTDDAFLQAEPGTCVVEDRRLCGTGARP